jgi:hypothetical protein
MPTPSYKRNMRKNSGIYLGATQGRAVPHNKKRACLCKDQDTYSYDCCNGNLIGQSIGSTASAATRQGAFSDGFSQGFDIKPI